jgi:hypothetical protein
MPRFFALAALVAVAGCAHLPWPFAPSDDWTVTRTKRFAAYGPGDEPPAATLETLEQAALMLESAWFRGRAVGPLDVLLVDWPEFRHWFGPRRTGITIAELPGRGRIGKHGVVVMYWDDTTRAGTLHRLTHLFVHAIAPKAPLWLHEGLAGFAELGSYREGDEKAMACFGQLPQKQTEIPIADLFAWSWSAFDESDKASAYRFTAVSVVDYLMLGEGGKRRDKFLDLVAAFAEGAESEAALTKVYPDLTAAALQEKLGEHRAASEKSPRPACPVAFPVVPERAGKLRIEPVAAEDRATLLMRMRMLPRRDGQVDWYPPAMIGVAGGQFPPAEAAEK